MKKLTFFFYQNRRKKNARKFNKKKLYILTFSLFCCEKKKRTKALQENLTGYFYLKFEKTRLDMVFKKVLKNC